MTKEHKQTIHLYQSSYQSFSVIYLTKIFVLKLCVWLETVWECAVLNMQLISMYWKTKAVLMLHYLFCGHYTLLLDSDQAHVLFHNDQQIHFFWTKGPNLCFVLFNFSIWEKNKTSATLTWWVLLLKLSYLERQKEAGAGASQLKCLDCIYISVLCFEGNLDHCLFSWCSDSYSQCYGNANLIHTLVIFLFHLLHLAWLVGWELLLLPWKCQIIKKNYLAHPSVWRMFTAPQAVTVIMHQMAEWTLWRLEFPLKHEACGSAVPCFNCICIYKLLPNFIWIFKR